MFSLFSLFVCLFVEDPDFSMLWIDGWYDGSDWVWESNGDLITSGYVNAKAGADFSSAPFNPEMRCVRMESNGIEFGKWSPEWCSINYRYICE